MLESRRATFRKFLEIRLTPVLVEKKIIKIDNDSSDFNRMSRLSHGRMTEDVQLWLNVAMVSSNKENNEICLHSIFCYSDVIPFFFSVPLQYKMSFNVWPAFSFNLDRIIVGSVKFGKYDGIHVCLTAVTSTDKVILHSGPSVLGSCLSSNRVWS